jgi:predicted PurR-regulated permease PerM
MSDPQGDAPDGGATSHVVETAIRIGLLFVLAAWCVLIVQPFLVPIVWGIIIAVASYPGYLRLLGVFGGRRALATTTFSLLLLLAIMVPVALLSGTLVEGAQGLMEQFKEGRIRIQPPPPGVAEWPFIGGWVAAYWSGAAEDPEAILLGIVPHFKDGGQWLLEAVAGAGLGLLQFLVATIIAGVLLARADPAKAAALAIARRLAGVRGLEFASLAEATVRSVTRGILGVAVIQAILAGLGFLAAGVPAAGLWALIALILSVVQVGVFPVLIPVLIYLFFTADLLTTLLFLGWAVFVGSIDNVLKPILLGRGVAVPMWVVFIGAIGGLLSMGIIGLFIGPVVLVLGYTLFLAWLYEMKAPALAATLGSELEATDEPLAKSPNPSPVRNQ